MILAEKSSEAADWLNSFTPFSISHGVILMAFAAITAFVASLGRRWRGGARQFRLEQSLGAAGLAFWLFSTIWQLLPANFDFAESLPLHVCDWLGLIAPLALMTGARRLRTLVYFWAMGLSTQSLLTPVVREGPLTAAFWIFWINHSFIVGAAIYELIARDLRPTWADYRSAVMWGVVYLSIILPFDLAMGVNYGYVGRGKPEQATIIDALGPWPGRLALLIPLVCLALFLPLAPWLAVRRWRRPAVAAATS